MKHLSTNLWLRKSALSKKTGLAPIYCRVSYSKKDEIDIITNIKVSLKEWDNETKKVIRSSKAKEYNKRLLHIVDEIHKIDTRLFDLDQERSAKIIKNTIEYKSSQTETLDVQSTENQNNETQERFAENLNYIIEKFYGNRSILLANSLKLSKSVISSFINGKLTPVYATLKKMYELGISIDFLIGGSTSPLVGGARDFEEAFDLLNSVTKNVIIKDDKMSPTFTLADTITVKKVEPHELEVGSLYHVEKLLGGSFSARLVSENFDWVYDNKLYNSFKYVVSENDKYIGKLIKKTSSNFSAPF